MDLPFTIDQFLNVFKNYNESVWPMQIFLFLMAIGVIFLIYKKYSFSNKCVLFSLSFLWLWIGIVYHWIFFSQINKPAFGFGGLFVIQGVLFLFLGLKNRVEFSFRKKFDSIMGVIFVLFALIIYPLMNYFFSHVWPYNPTFGLPCPTVIFTLGVLLLSIKGLPKYIVAIPLLWSLIGVSAAINLGIWEDVALVAAGIVGSILIFKRK